MSEGIGHAMEPYLNIELLYVTLGSRAVPASLTAFVIFEVAITEAIKTQMDELTR